MKGFLRSRLSLTLAAFIMVSAAIAIPLSNNIIHSHAQGTVTFTEYPITTSNSLPLGITAGHDGNLWFTEYDTNQIGRITTAGLVTEFPLPTSCGSTSGCEPFGITAGPDGNLWFTEFQASQIGRITPSGSITEYPLPTSNSLPADITAGSDGNLWFTEDATNQIGRITPSGSITEYPLPTANSGPYGITAGPDGNLWFTEGNGNNIGRVNLSSTTTFTYPIASSNVRFTIGYGIQNPSLVGPNGCYWDSTKHQYVPFSQLWHAGEDWFAKTSAGATTISAVANGVVKYVSPPGYNYPGAVIIIQHTLSDGSLVYSMYGHLDPQKLLVNVGDTVTKGQSIASGLISQKSEGGDNTHLHWEIRYFFDGSGITKGPNYKQTCSAQPGPGYTWPGQPDNFVFNGTTYRWTNPSQFVAAHM